MQKAEHVIQTMEVRKMCVHQSFNLSHPMQGTGLTTSALTHFTHYALHYTT